MSSTTELPRNKAAPAGTSAATDRPLHPLTAYNIFFRYERARCLLRFKLGQASEDQPYTNVTAAEVRDFMQKNPPHTPGTKKKRVHCKDHGAVSFKDLTRSVSRAWKSLDGGSKTHFQIVAHELKVKHYQAIEDERRRAKAADRANCAIEGEERNGGRKQQQVREIGLRHPSTERTFGAAGVTHIRGSEKSAPSTKPNLAPWQVSREQDIVHQLISMKSTSNAVSKEPLLVIDLQAASSSSPRQVQRSEKPLSKRFLARARDDDF